MVAPIQLIDVAPAAAPPSSRELAARLWTDNLPRQHGFEPLVVEGTLPAELRGTLYRNGPGQFEQFGTRYSHPFEGDGAVTAVRFDGSRAFGSSMLTESAGLGEERRAGRVLYGLAAPWSRRIRNVLGKRDKNTANTNVMMWQGRLFALMEAARPTELDPRDLRTIGETDLDGAIVAMFSAHPHRVAARRATYNFGLEYGRKTKLHCYELPDVGPARRLGAVELSYAPMLHDFIATETHLVFFVSPVRIHVPRMLLQLGSFEQLFRYQPEHGTEVICVPIDRPAEVVRFTVDAFYQWHFTNACSRGDELVIDYVRYPGFESFLDIGALGRGGTPEALGEGRAHRARIDLAARSLRSEQVLDASCEFPTVAPGAEGRAHRYAYLALDNLRAVGKHDTETNAVEQHALPATQRATEPLFVPRPGAASEDDGWVVALCHDDPSNRAFVAVYDARRLGAGPIARVWFDHQVPITFHGTFSPAG
ncbi:MAG TPA: carotenoid oxygenase family protein [Kofleriaceae bacterium]|nr:carotenoid oxygenase family protein [Kofleriaceae bacterium]